MLSKKITAETTEKINRRVLIAIGAIIIGTQRNTITENEITEIIIGSYRKGTQRLKYVST